MRLLRCLAQLSQLSEQALTVPSFGGSLTVRAACPVRVRPTSTLDYPDLDRATVRLLGRPDGSRDQEPELLVTQEGHRLNVQAEAGLGGGQLELEVEVPIVHNVTVTTTGQAGIECSDMIESQYCHLTSEEGGVVVAGLKTANLIVQTEGGDVVCRGAIQGSVTINTGAGGVTGERRFLGPSLNITTEQGDIDIASCYSEQSKFSTMTGRMNLRNIHNESFVAGYGRTGGVSMQGVDGSTNVWLREGDLDIQVSHCMNESRVHVEEGNIRLKMADNHPVKVCATGLEVEVDTKFSDLGSVGVKEDCPNYQHYLGILMPDQFSPTCQVMADSGKVSVAAQSWAASFGLKLPDLNH